MTLEERITRLEDIEAIRALQAKYQRCLDTRDFDGLAECFAEDVVSSYGNGSMAYEGREAVLEFLRGAAIYDVDYVKREGRWLIRSIGYKRCYEYVELRGLLNIFSLRKTTFLDALKKKR